MRTVLNQNGQAVQLHTFSETADQDNESFSDSVPVAVHANDPNGRIVQITSDISFMIRVARGGTPSVTTSTAHMFLTAGVPYYVQLPGTEDVDVADQWHIHARGLVAATAGRLTVMEIESFVGG